MQLKLHYIQQHVIYFSFIINKQEKAYTFHQKMIKKREVSINIKCFFMYLIKSIIKLYDLIIPIEK